MHGGREISFVIFFVQETSRAISVLNVMLQRRLNNSGSQNGSFAQERGSSFYSTPPTGPPKSPQLVELQSNTVWFMAVYLSLLFLKVDPATKWSWFNSMHFTT